MCVKASGKMSAMVEMRCFMAKQMQNFILVGDAGKCVVVDACWDVEGISS